MGAVPPDIASSELRRPIERALLVQQHAIAAIREALYAAEDVYREEHRESGTAVRLLNGSDVIRAALQQAREACEHELLTAKPGGTRPLDNLARALPNDLVLLSRGVKQRTLYQHTVRTHGPTLAYIEKVTTAGAEIRTLDELFDRLIIYDRRIAFIPDPLLDVSTAALVIEHPAIVHYLATVFDHAWQRAEPVSITPEQIRPPLMTDETRRAVLRLMVEGHTDAAISKRLGISTRTVSTHIRKASEALNSRSRAQLAYLLAKSELLDDVVL
ncbi:LuxR C-terminal-related transcriptional regulator [Streptomyces phyllanthi]|uniref:LuxR family transcriptional regulator n=1 Tax=Streptomyces phyllanthi TaxID=1803180 RepID=A0A5N8VV74_9ACTN|nr:LuxR C-terminal-related transcriptional regulator [Streptomyces phyllanthi]MPY39167.1 LuxR family transcriptional regulator [Streptomyces phyllanthi]